MQRNNAWSRRALVATVVMGSALLPIAGAVPAFAQGNPVLSNVIPESAAMTIHARIKSIDPATRMVTLVNPSGQAVTVKAGEAVRLEMLKVGDTVNAKYYRSVAFLISQPGAVAPEDQMKLAVARPVQAPGGVAIRQTTLSGVVVGLNPAANSVDMVDPSGGGVYTLHVSDPARAAALSTLKVGDTVTAVVSEALAVSIEPAPKSLFSWL
jgi:Cu/Ag efflux protein CusF